MVISLMKQAKYSIRWTLSIGDVELSEHCGDNGPCAKNMVRVAPKIVRARLGSMAVKSRNALPGLWWQSSLFVVWGRCMGLKIPLDPAGYKAGKPAETHVKEPNGMAAIWLFYMERVHLTGRG